MNPCIVCRRFTQDNIKTVEDAIDGIKIRHILSDLNYKVSSPFKILFNIKMYVNFLVSIW